MIYPVVETASWATYRPPFEIRRIFANVYVWHNFFTRNYRSVPGMSCDRIVRYPALHKYLIFFVIGLWVLVITLGREQWDDIWAQNLNNWANSCAEFAFGGDTVVGQACSSVVKSTRATSVGDTWSTYPPHTRFRAHPLVIAPRSLTSIFKRCYFSIETKAVKKIDHTVVYLRVLRPTFDMFMLLRL